ncbi:glutamate racemase [Helicobacter monodelphidis]|uniref:glutamate racemase n=1 Tax=Helicobacter sp. 15-1451 TaxID=2004995 RepID=UPI000DCD7A50|nr:glutamate racemase [Helicobacter sp. 15-1451]RAX58439.1 glutamate racemase [Helicobacter sp. 15-1451]
MRVGVFDSGIGGLSVLKSLLYSHAFKQIIYFGDTARVPYGVKDCETIVRYSLEALRFLEEFGIDLCVVACNTASAFGLETLKQEAKIDVIGVIEPGVLALTNRIRDKNAPILVIGTKATIKSNQYAESLQNLGYKCVYSIATSLFVPFVEEGVTQQDLLFSIFDYYFKHLSFIPAAIILGCTHFPMLATALSEYFSNKPLLIHSGEAIMEYITSCYTLEKYPDTEVLYFASENVESLKQTAKIWLKG